jgi:protein-glucosylgalactosylhydroxylysine glucosidase
MAELSKHCRINRLFLFNLIGYALMATAFAREGLIDRRALVDRHNPVNRDVDKLSPLSVGNGQFAFTADVTGLQTFADAYEEGIPLSTQSQWGWHSFPNPEDYELKDALKNYDHYGRDVPYASEQDTAAGKWLRASPHRLGLARIGFELTKKNGKEVVIEDLRNVMQKLDLWTGALHSNFAIEGETVDVKTICHPEQDAIAVSVSSNLIKDGRLKVSFRFAYGSDQFGKAPEDWTKPDRHTTTMNTPHTGVDPLKGLYRGRGRDLADVSNSRAKFESQVRLLRKLDADTYAIDVIYSPGAKFAEVDRHHFELSNAGDSKLVFVARFSSKPVEVDVPTFLEIDESSASHWENFWQSGGVIELAGSKDPRAKEVERRIVLSQYLTAIQCAGNAPPQETGLTFNSWFGKSHLEMHWWHAVHFALWNRLEMLERSLGWYDKVIRRADDTAWMQGYRGARWPKMVGPGGRESPSGVGVFLIWQQPHPIYYAELVYRQKPTPETLAKYRHVVFDTAEFMASYAHWDEKTQRYVLGPPMIPAQEHYPPRTTFNPPYELEYWYWALNVAQDWRERLGMPRDETWQKVIDKLSPLPITDGVYDTAEGVWVDTDHPSHLMALGFLPGKRADAEVMRRTLKRVMGKWQWDKTWGWDYPMVAMTAARIGEPETAIDALMMDVQKNTFLTNGHNYQDDRLPIYLPGNGGLLAVTAMMAAGWDGAPERHAPGFPDNGQWTVRWENLP